MADSDHNSTTQSHQQTTVKPSPDKQTCCAEFGDPTNGRLPDFIIIGAAKSGTTTLFEYLLRHPNIFICDIKEPMFFSRNHIYERGYDWYRSLFAAARADQKCGEASTCYSRWPSYENVPARLARAIPEVKLIYIMRHPVERAYSHYSHEMAHRGEVAMGFEQSLEHFSEIIDGGMYMNQIDLYLQFFDRDQMLFLLFDDLKKSPTDVFNRIQLFLGIQPLDLVTGRVSTANPGGTPAATKKIDRGLRRVRGWPGVKQLADLAPASFRAGVLQSLRRRLEDSPLGEWLAKRHRKQLTPMTPDIRRRLLERFEPDTRRLEQFLEKPLPDWFI